MIPLRDVIPSRTTPWVTMTLIVVNTLVFLFELSLPEQERDLFLGGFGLVPYHFTWLTVVTSMFLHGGVLHVLGNMWYLWIFGDNVEDRMGHLRFLIFYLFCGTVAATAQVATTPESHIPIVGASGAIAGVMGAYFVLFPQSRILTLLPIVIFWEIIEVPAIYFLGFWFLLQIFSGVGSVAVSTADTGGIAFWAHVAGFAAGFVGVYAFRRAERQKVEWWDR